MNPDADIYRGDDLVGHLTRVSKGIRLDVFLEKGFIATSLLNKELETPDLPPFFMNLLPEGARLKLLLESARNRDDSLELLLRVGEDAIGDIAIVPHGSVPPNPAPLVPFTGFEEVSFWELFRRGSGASPDGTVPGVQEKISASTIAFGVKLASKPNAILKLNPPAFPNLVQNEAFFLRMATDCGLEVNAFNVVRDRTGEVGLLVDRFDRVRDGKVLKKLHVEDGCQLLGLTPADKYRVSFRQIVDVVAKTSSAPKVSVSRLLRLYAFSYLIGNSDLHAKNVSLLWKDVIKLSPAYDLISTLPYPNIERRMALKLDAKDDRFRVEDFVRFGSRYELTDKALRNSVLEVAEGIAPWLDRLHEIGFDAKVTESLSAELTRRANHFLSK